MADKEFLRPSHARAIAITRGPMRGFTPRLGLSVFAAVLAACGSSVAESPSATSSAGHDGTFDVMVSFTGAGNVQGSFTTPTVGATCAQYATSALAWTIGLGPPIGNPILVDGQNINFVISLPQSSFHGTGTYTGNVVSGVSVGLDTFAGTDSTMTINRDGSGKASFANLIGTTSSADESGTIVWTCSG